MNILQVMTLPIITNKLKEKMRQYNLSLNEVLSAFNNSDREGISMGEGLYKRTKAYSDYKIGVIYTYSNAENNYVLISCWKFILK